MKPEKWLEVSGIMHKKLITKLLSDKGRLMCIFEIWKIQTEIQI